MSTSVIVKMVGSCAQRVPTVHSVNRCSLTTYPRFCNRVRCTSRISEVCSPFKISSCRLACPASLLPVARAITCHGAASPRIGSYPRRPRSDGRAIIHQCGRAADGTFRAHVAGGRCQEFRFADESASRRSLLPVGRRADVGLDLVVPSRFPCMSSTSSPETTPIRSPSSEKYWLALQAGEFGAADFDNPGDSCQG